jgi:transcriptional regulator GlxA family with amidase domain
MRVMAPFIEQEILYRLLSGPVGPRLVQIAMSETPSHRIASALSWLKKNFARPLRIGVLARSVGMSESAFR